LSSIRHASLVICMALARMLVPANIYLWVISAGILWPELIFTAASRGWGIPMATDTAFALAILALLGSRASRVAVLVLSTLAIIDVIGTVVVIGFFTQNRSIRNH